MKLKPVIRILFVVVAWSFSGFTYYWYFDHQNVFDFLPGILIFIASVVSVISLYFDNDGYRQTKKLRAFFPTLVAIICVGCYFGLREYLLRQDRTPVVLAAYANKGLFGTSLSIDFRENGTFKCGRWGFMNKDFVRGRYTMKDSIIYLDRSNLHDMVISNKLLMKTMMVAERKQERSLLKWLFGKRLYDTIPETHLLQLNTRGDTIPNALRLKVIE